MASFNAATLPMTARLGEIAAIAHRAPTSVLQSACIDKEPSAPALVLTLSDLARGYPSAVRRLTARSAGTDRARLASCRPDASTTASHPTGAAASSATATKTDQGTRPPIAAAPIAQCRRRRGGRSTPVA